MRAMLRTVLIAAAIPALAGCFEFDPFAIDFPGCNQAAPQLAGRWGGQLGAHDLVLDLAEACEYGPFLSGPSWVASGTWRWGAQSGAARSDVYHFSGETRVFLARDTAVASASVATFVFPHMLPNNPSTARQLPAKTKLVGTVTGDFALGDEPADSTTFDATPLTLTRQ